MKTMRYLEMDHTEMDRPHGIWLASRMQPYMVPAATTRARALVGRLGLNYMPWKSDNLCPLCNSENETTEHFIAKCQELDHIRSPMTEKLNKFYHNEGKPPPRTDDEITSAWLNGDRYRTPSTHTVTILRDSEIHNLASVFCHKMYQERDYIINEKLMNRANAQGLN